MGCGESKGKAEGENKESGEIEFKDTGVYSLDNFFESAKKLMDAFKDITGPLGEQKEKFYDVTGFYEVCGAEVKHAFIGMFISLSSQCNGQMESLHT
jgi:hypothetical protein